MIEYIRMGRSNFSFLQFLENKAIDKELQRNLTLQLLYYDVVDDTLGFDSLQLRQILSMYHNPEMRIEEVYWELGNRNFEKVKDIINNPNLSYGKVLEKELADEKFWIYKMLDVLENDKDEYFLSEPEKAEIREFALGGDTKARNQAKSFMEFYYNEYLFDKPINSARIAQNPNKNQKEKTKLETTNGFITRISPNPASDFLTVELNKSNSTITIKNALGEIVYNNMVGGLNTKIDISEFSAGVYFVSIENETTKLIINR